MCRGRLRAPGSRPLLPFPLRLLSLSSHKSGPARLMQPSGNLRATSKERTVSAVCLWQADWTSAVITTMLNIQVLASTSLCAKYWQVCSCNNPVHVRVNFPYCLFPTLGNIIACVYFAPVWNIQTLDDITWIPFRYISVEFSMTKPWYIDMHSKKSFEQRLTKHSWWFWCSKASCALSRVQEFIV